MAKSVKSGGRSPFKGDMNKASGSASTNYGGRPAVPKGKGKQVDMGSMGSGNRRTAKVAMVGDGGSLGVNFCGHGGFTRT